MFPEMFTPKGKHKHFLFQAEVYVSKLYPLLLRFQTELRLIALSTCTLLLSVYCTLCLCLVNSVPDSFWYILKVLL